MGKILLFRTTDLFKFGSSDGKLHGYFSGFVARVGLSKVNIIMRPVTKIPHEKYLKPFVIYSA